MKYSQILSAVAIITVVLSSCKGDDTPSPRYNRTITIQNVLASQPIVESGTYKGTGTPPVILPGQSISIQFSAAKGEAIAFASMYGWSNDCFFAPENPGIMVYDANGNPIQGDVSAQIKLWDNGSRINQPPGATVNHPGVADNKNIIEVQGTDAQGNTYLPASQLVNAQLVYNGNSYFTLTLKNTSGGTPNETPLSPGVWAVSYNVGGTLQNPAPFYTKNQSTTPSLTALAETGNNMPLSNYITGITGIFTPMSPVLLVVYNGYENPIFKIGELDRGQGLKLLAQRGNADTIAAAMRRLASVTAVYVLPAPDTKVLLPQIGATAGGSVTQSLTVGNGDRIAIATMYGFSNDWFFATATGFDATKPGDFSGTVGLYDDGTAINQFPGAGITQFNLAGTPLNESIPIAPVPNPNGFTTLPAIQNIISVKLQ
jgi:hypothetical protein